PAAAERMAHTLRRTAARTRAAPALESQPGAVSKGATPSAAASTAEAWREAAGTQEVAGTPAAAWACLPARLSLPDAAGCRLAWSLSLWRDHTPKSERAAQHFGPVWPADDALAGHRDEQAVLDDARHGLQ